MRLVEQAVQAFPVPAHLDRERSAEAGHHLLERSDVESAELAQLHP